MDYETKILLNRLAEEVEQLNEPDWWIIGITVVNAIIMAWLGWRQYKLQQQQTKIQEHEVYKSLYSLINSIHNTGRSFVNSLFFALKDCKNDAWGIGQLQNIRKEINDLSLKLSESKIDLELKTNISNLEYANYVLFLHNAYGLIFDILILLKDNAINSFDIDYRTTTNENEIIDLVLANTIESKKDYLKKQFENHIKLKNRIDNYKILESLKKHCVL
jgi:hypothetical protein